jgi:ribosomal protein S18 acetylase RimI-like enzyme
MMVGLDLQVRPAVLTDQRQIGNLIHFSPHVHRHLDWRSPVDWIGSPPYFVLENQGQVIAALGCPPDPPLVSWIRLFVNSGINSLQESWQLLWESALSELTNKGHCITAAIVLQDWLQDILISSGFNCSQSIVMLERNGGNPPGNSLPAEISLRAMMPFDLDSVTKVDASAFDLLWRNTLPILERAYSQAAFATVAETGGQVIGYQLSTRSPLGVHLARLAVRPDMQGKGLGAGLVDDLIQKTGQRGLSHLTVNTQSDNLASLALYQRMGFHEMGERYPVFQLQI